MGAAFCSVEALTSRGSTSSLATARDASGNTFYLSNSSDLFSFLDQNDIVRHVTPEFPAISSSTLSFSFMDSFVVCFTIYFCPMSPRGFQWLL